MSTDRNVTLRRNVEQVKHCVEEALSVMDHGEDLRCAVDDLEQARQLIDVVLPKLKPTPVGAIRSR